MSPQQLKGININWDAVSFHLGCSGHVTAAQQSARQVDVGQHCG